MNIQANLAAACAVLLLAACGGSSPQSNASTGGNPPPAAPVKFTTGAITARSAGSIQVNHLTLSTTQAKILMENVQESEGELKPGMVVRIKARHDGKIGEAVEIEFEDAVKGKVAAVGTSALSVGGQTVRVDDSTEFEDNTARLGSIHVEDRVRVSGVPDDKGGLRATRIEKHRSGVGEDFEVKGVVSNLSATGFILKISPDAGPEGTYTVNLLGGAILPAGLANGSYVEVRSQKPVQAGQVIEAASISMEDGKPGDPQSETEVEGIVTSAVSPAQFRVAGVAVTTTASTLWDGGLPEDLVPGVKVEAEGTLGTDGVLAARKVSFRANIRLQGAVSSPVVQAGGTGAFVVNGVLVKVDALTDQRTALSSLSVGQIVKLRGVLGRDGVSVAATRMESSNDDRPIIQGVVTAKDAAARTLTILGKTIAAASASAMGHSDVSGVDGPSMTLDAFFTAVVPGETVVKARGRDAAAFADPVLTAKEIELEGQR